MPSAAEENIFSEVPEPKIKEDVMKDELKFLEDTDRYIDGEMNEKERAAFEQLCVGDPEARHFFEEHNALRNQLQDRKDRKEARKAIGNAFLEWDGMQEADNQRRPSPLLWKITAIAASLALLISIGGVWVTLNRYDNHKTKSYTILRREIDNIKRSQKDLINDIHSSSKEPANPGQYGGTGFAISTNGYIATNAHVIKDADSVYVYTQEGKPLKANIVYQDKKCDLAVLKVADSTFTMPKLPFSLPIKSAPLGEDVYTMGYPRNEIVYGQGYVSAETGFEGDSDSYQITLPVNPGNSGGPLIDAQGHLLGIISGKQSATDNIAFAVKSSFLLSMIDSLPTDFPKQSLQSNGTPLQHLSRINQIKKLKKYVFLVKVFN